MMENVYWTEVHGGGWKSEVEDGSLRLKMEV
jgi:hypothetical protein